MTGCGQFPDGDTALLRGSGGGGCKQRAGMFPHLLVFRQSSALVYALESLPHFRIGQDAALRVNQGTVELLAREHRGSIRGRGALRIGAGKRKEGHEGEDSHVTVRIRRKGQK